MNRQEPNIKQVLTTCSWCEHKIGTDEPVYSLGCKKHPEVDISKYEGRVMPVRLTTSDKTIWAIVPREDSDARREGNDFLFTLCSEKCGDQLKEVLDLEIDLGELILSVNHIH